MQLPAFTRCDPQSSEGGHAEQSFALIQQRQSATDEARHAAFVEQTLQISSTAAWHVKGFTALAITDLERTCRRLADNSQQAIAG